MRTDLTEVVMVIDRSGSMGAIRFEAEGAVNDFIKEQKKDNDVLLTLVQFDTKYEFIHKGVPIENARPYHLHPRGMTALYDAIGRTIQEVGERLALTPEEERPGLVIFVICTDGYENASLDFQRHQISDMIQHQESKYNWQFIYLGANQNAIKVGKELGISTSANYSGPKIETALDAVTRSARSMKKNLSQGEFVVNKFTDKELSEMV